MRIALLLTSLAVVALLRGSFAGAADPTNLPLPAFCDNAVVICPPETPIKGTPVPLAEARGSVDLPNPALGQSLISPGNDPLAVFSRRPLDKFIIPAGGLFLDPLHNGPHYGVDYASPDDYLNGVWTYFHPIGPGYVTARSTCLPCFADGDKQGRVKERAARYNFGWGGYVIVETPYNRHLSIYVIYGHIARDFVSLADYVTPDDVIGVVGSSGYSEEFHLHMEIRYGAPGRFWNADLSDYATLDRWLATMVADPVLFVFPENHPTGVDRLQEWIAQQPQPMEMP